MSIMKKKLLFIAGILCVQYSNAQIVIESSDIIQAGMTIERVRDTIATVEHGPDGANQTWVFTNVVPHVQINTSSVSPSSTPTSSYNSSANQALTTNNETWLYMNLSNASFTAKGIYGNVLGNGNNINIPINPDQTLMVFPTVYGNSFTDNSAYDVTLSGSDVGLPVYEVRNKRTSIINDSIKGWGELTTPVGVYNSLKGKRVELYYDSVWTKLAPFAPWTLSSSETNTTVSYYWLAKEGKLPVAEISNSGRLTWTLTPPLPNTPNVGIEDDLNIDEIIVFPNPAKSHITVTADASMLGSSYTIYDNSGKAVLFGKITTENTLIELEDLSGGLYLLRVGENTKKTFKIIKE
jgi:hypothetical protein